ncbi:putative RNA-directed DNA polymerase like protein [Argiope bruennichi]|uniref:Putative RNA-directed DNA polymerase like protein n=1 Tax=Argiope bruennichi TaxID=94029 RepID=A0A8T0E3C0_ARGBR|nr:putative RNA-directed DNA polymerase like protein [Argiope bruennichi]
MGKFDADMQSFTEAKGGLKFDVVLSDSPSRRMRKVIPSPTKKDLSLSEIEDKLEAAEQRRLSQLYKEQNMRSRRLNRVLEVQKNKNTFIKRFKTKAMESYDKKMRKTGKNREAYLMSIQKKNRDLLMRVNEIKNTTLFLRENHFDTFCRKFEIAEQTRAAQFNALEDRLKKIDKKAEQVSTHVQELTALVKSLAKELRQSSTSWCSSLLTHRSCTSLPMNRLTNDLNPASSVEQSNQGRVRGLGKGPRSISKPQSPSSLKTLRILQCNINGLTTLATRAKLDQLLKFAELNNVQVIALQETKLKVTSSLKYRGYNIFRKDRTTKSGGGLAFLIKDVKYQSIVIPTDQTSDLEIQGIKILWRGKPLNIFNVYHPPNHKNLAAKFSNFMDKNSIFIGDLNAKHTAWAVIVITIEALIYNTSEALDIAMTSAELVPQCSWSVLDNIGSDHLPILIELNKKQKIFHSKENFWNFNKANWASFSDSVDKEIPTVPMTGNLNNDWNNFKNIILKYAKACIPRGNVKRYVPCYTKNTAVLEPFLEKRKSLLEASGPVVNNRRTAINKINAEIKLTYAHLKRSRWNELCSKIDPRTPNTKLWKIIKGICKEQIQNEECNTIRNTNGQIFPDDKSAANGLAAHYQSTSRLHFTNEDKPILSKARNIVHGCRSTDLGDPTLTKQFSMRELLIALTFLDINKSPGPDGLSGRLLEYLGSMGKQKLIDLFNLSWKKGRLPQGWKKAIIIPVKKPNKNSSSPEDFRPIALTCTTSKVMEKMILIRLQFFLNQNNLMPCEQYGFRRGHSTIDQVLYFAQTIRDAHNHKPTHHTVAAFLDLTKAFDRVWKHKLIIKLHNSFNIRGNTLAWISDYLQQRSIRVSCVVIANYKSTSGLKGGGRIAQRQERKPQVRKEFSSYNFQRGTQFRLEFPFLPPIRVYKPKPDEVFRSLLHTEERGSKERGLRRKIYGTRSSEGLLPIPLKEGRPNG